MGDGKNGSTGIMDLSLLVCLLLELLLFINSTGRMVWTSQLTLVLERRMLKMQKLSHLLNDKSVNQLVESNNYRESLGSLTSVKWMDDIQVITNKVKIL